VVGDLMLTCSSDQSRNYRYGIGLARGDEQEMQKLLSATVEGYHTSHSIRYIARQLQLELPLAFLTLKIINDREKGASHFRQLISQC
jgi:glycerol-3-phosphate dehydrogenase (NAD(P)+)